MDFFGRTRLVGEILMIPGTHLGCNAGAIAVFKGMQDVKDLPY